MLDNFYVINKEDLRKLTYLNNYTGKYFIINTDYKNIKVYKVKENYEYQTHIHIPLVVFNYFLCIDFLINQYIVYGSRCR